jgi:hypothetical protein
MSGMPPPTAASNRIETPAALAASKISGPRSAISALLAGGERPQDQIARRLHPTHQLDHQPDIGMIHDRLEIVGGVFGRERALPAQVADRDFDELELDTRLGGDGLAIGQQLARERPAHRSSTEDSYTDTHL